MTIPIDFHSNSIRVDVWMIGGDYGANDVLVEQILYGKRLLRFWGFGEGLIWIQRSSVVFGFGTMLKRVVSIYIHTYVKCNMWYRVGGTNFEFGWIRIGLLVYKCSKMSKPQYLIAIVGAYKYMFCIKKNQ